jgi:alcohol dehydrogenase
MTPFTGQFTLPRLERVIAGPGTLDALPAELDLYACRRVVLVTGATLGKSSLVERLSELLQDRLATVFTGARQHVPAGTVQALLQTMRDVEADSLVSVGGGSPIDTAKCAVHALITSRTTETEIRRKEEEGRRKKKKVSARSAALPSGSAGDLPIHIAIPTTLSAGEFTDVAGMTDEATHIKHALRDSRLAPRTVIADPVLTLETPEWLWAGSGVRALDHAIETLYSNTRHPISEPLAARAIEMLAAHLPRSIHGPEDERIAHRGECQMAAWLAVFGVTNAGFGLSHVLGHQIGPRWNVAHGVTSAIMLPHVMRFMADAVPSRFSAIARAFGVPFDAADEKRAALACAARTAALIAQLGLPHRLRDVSVPRDELDEIAGLVSGLMARAHVVPRPVSGADVAAILAAAY